MKSFEPNCTIPARVPAFVSGPPVRGTLSIVWSCLTILVLCTWNVQHLNVPIQVKCKNFSEKARHLYWSVCRKAKWMVITLLAPEVVMAKALEDLFSAMVSRKCMTVWAKRDEVPWTVGHSFFADMGGFAVRFKSDAMTAKLEISNPEIMWQEKDGQVTVGSEGTSTDQQVQAGDFEESNEVDREEPHLAAAAKVENGRSLSKAVIQDAVSPDAHDDIRSMAFAPRWNLEHLHDRYTKSPGRIGKVDWHREETNYEMVKQAVGIITREELERKLRSPKVWYHNLAVLQGDTWILDGPQLLHARQFGIIDRLPRLTEEQLDDRNKGDALVKLIAIVQIGWLVVELITRRVRNLASTQLEVFTLAFAICSLVTYGILFKKPQDAKVPIDVPARRHPTAAEMAQLTSEGPRQYWIVRINYWMPNNSFHQRSWPVFPIAIGAGSILFGCIHLIAWNFAFPTNTEQLLWRIAAIITTISPLLSVAVYHIGSSSNLLRNVAYARFGPTGLNNLLVLLQGLMVVPYVAARMYILVEIIRTLYFLPPTAYVATWTKNAPYTD